MSNHPTGLDRPIPARLPSELTLPSSVYDSNRGCADYIIEINERLATVREVEKLLKAAGEAAKAILLERLEIEGMKHFAFDDLGTFTRTEKVNISFPSNENGGRKAASDWLKLCIERGLMTFEEMLDVQQSRVSDPTVVSLEQAVEEFNEKNPSNPIPPSPFSKYVTSKLSTPTKRKG